MIRGVPSKFGARVIGKEAAAAALVQNLSKTSKFGPLVTGSKVKPGTNTPATDSVRVTAGMSIEKMREVLESNPSFVQAFVDAEWRRLRAGPGTGPRKGALAMFVEYADKPGALHPDASAALKARVERYLATGDDEELKALETRQAALDKGPKTTLSEAKTGR